MKKEATSTLQPQAPEATPAPFQPSYKDRITLSEKANLEEAHCVYNQFADQSAKRANLLLEKIRREYFVFEETFAQPES